MACVVVPNKFNVLYSVVVNIISIFVFPERNKMVGYAVQVSNKVLCVMTGCILCPFKYASFNPLSCIYVSKGINFLRQIVVVIVGNFALIAVYPLICISVVGPGKFLRQVTSSIVSVFYF